MALPTGNAPKPGSELTLWLSIQGEPVAPPRPHSMKLALRLSLATLIVSSALGQIRPSAVMLRYPDVSAAHIAFRFDGDLWLAPKEGGLARRITSADGDENFPKFSPDGNHLAFQAAYDGGRDLYVMSVNGGVPARVTYHSGGEGLSGWHPDGEHLLFHSSEVSGIARAPKIFTVHTTGSQPQPIDIPFGTFGAIDETGEWLAYTPTSREFRTWRRYRGGTAQDVWLFNLKTHESRRVTDDPGTDAMPMWHGRDVVFLSDRGSEGIENLYAYNLDSGETRQLTTFDESGVKFPSIGPDDVVFENMGKLYRYSFSEAAVVEVTIEIPGDRPRLRPRYHDLSEAVSGVRMSPGGKRVVLEARGEIFTAPVGDGAARNLTRTSGVAERYPSWSPDGKWIAYWSDRSGEYELTLRRPDGSEFEGSDDHGEMRITSLGAGWKYAADWSPDSTKPVFGLQTGELYLHDLETKEQILIDRNPGRGLIRIDWSADSSWLTWARRHSSGALEAIQLYDVVERKRHEVTSGMFSDSDPCFDLSGDWLFFTSARTFNPSYSEFDTTWIYDDANNVLAVPLRADVENPWAPHDSSDPVAEADEPAKGDEGAAGEESGDSSERMRIDLDDFEARAFVLPIEGANVRSLDGIDGKLLYIRTKGSGRSRWGGGEGTLHAYDVSKKKELSIMEGVSRFEVAADGKHLMVRAGGKDGVIAPAPGAKIEEPADYSTVAGTFDPRAEWQQMLHDVHRIFRDWFYDPTMHGVDWDAVRDRALASLEDATSRGDVGFLIGEMISELNVGHAYNRPGPEDGEESPEGPSVGYLGCDWTLEDGAYRISRVLGSSYDTDARSPLSTHGVDAGEGDWLLAVNGVPVDASRAVYAAFMGTAGRETVLTVNGSPHADGNEREVVVMPARSERSLRYRDWVAAKRAEVDEASGGRIGYIHVPSTAIGGQNELVRQFMGQYHKDALLVDERWNSGGQIPTRFIELLGRGTTNFWATRDQNDWNWPPIAHRGPKAMLINHAAGSGGDAFPYYFRQAGLGKLIGTRTWGGLVGISGNPALIDGASPSVPTFAFYELDGTWGVEGHGVEPDIEVLDDPAKMVGGKDPQLERAIAVLLEELESHQPLAERPAYPDRRGAGLPESDT